MAIQSQTRVKVPAAPMPSFTPVQTSLLQRKCACGGSPGVDGLCEECRSRRLSGQRRATNPTDSILVPSTVHKALSSSGQPVETGTRAFMKPGLGHEFSKMRVAAAMSGAIQTKLTVNQTGDKYEQEADQVAEQVMRMPEGGSPQPEILRRQAEEEDEEIQRQPEEKEEAPQAKESPGQTPNVTPELQSRINSFRGGGQPLPASTHSMMESRFGHDFSQVRIHTDTRAVETARALNARAYTVGRDIVFGAGQYAPETTVGKKLLVHELTHVVQQNRISPERIQKQPQSTVTPGTTEELKRELESLQKEQGPHRDNARIEKLKKRLAERGTPTTSDCPISLEFDGSHLTVKGEQNHSFPAVSGRPVNGTFDYSPERQRMETIGPIPEGIYWLNPSQLKNLWYYFGKFAAAWGSHRITIHPFDTTHTFGRGGFFIHGGSEPGSAGCIDLTSQMSAFAAIIKQYGDRDCKIILQVTYPKKNANMPHSQENRPIQLNGTDQTRIQRKPKDTKGPSKPKIAVSGPGEASTEEIDALVAEVIEEIVKLVSPMKLAQKDEEFYKATWPQIETQIRNSTLPDKQLVMKLRRLGQLEKRKRDNKQPGGVKDSMVKGVLSRLNQDNEFKQVYDEVQMLISQVAEKIVEVVHPVMAENIQKQADGQKNRLGKKEELSEKKAKALEELAFKALWKGNIEPTIRALIETPERASHKTEFPGLYQPDLVTKLKRLNQLTEGTMKVNVNKYLNLWLGEPVGGTKKSLVKSRILEEVLVRLVRKRSAAAMGPGKGTTYEKEFQEQLSPFVRQNIEWGLAGYIAIREAFLAKFGSIKRANTYYTQLEANTDIEFLGKPVKYVHRDFQAKFKAAESMLQQDDKDKDARESIKQIGGLSIRENRNNPLELSPHSLGFGIDLNAKKNPNIKSTRGSKLDLVVRGFTGVSLNAEELRKPFNEKESDEKGMLSSAQRLYKSSSQLKAAFAGEEAFKKKLLAYLQNAGVAVISKSEAPALLHREATATSIDFDEVYTLVKRAYEESVSNTKKKRGEKSDNTNRNALASLISRAKGIIETMTPTLLAEFAIDAYAIFQGAEALRKARKDAQEKRRKAPDLKASGSATNEAFVAQIATEGFFNLMPELVVALTSREGGGLQWLGVSKGTKDFMHFGLHPEPALFVLGDFPLPRNIELMREV